MKLLAFNGSPRKNWNTHTLLNEFCEGFKSKGGEVEVVHLYDLNFKGCISCFACKLKGGKSYGKCDFNDDLKKYLDLVNEIEAILIAAPIYIGDVSASTRALIERLTYPFIAYKKDFASLCDKKIKVGCIYNMGANEKRMNEANYMHMINFMDSIFKRVFNDSEKLIVNDTYQFNDYSKYESSMFDVNEKKKIRDTIFPLECKKAFEMGARFAAEII